MVMPVLAIQSFLSSYALPTPLPVKFWKRLIVLTVLSQQRNSVDLWRALLTHLLSRLDMITRMRTPKAEVQQASPPQTDMLHP
jgi:hypothetical protein